jgi:hypothetical protein
MESSFAKISIRAWVTLILVITFCLLCWMTNDLPPLEKAVFLVLGFYFGRSTQPAPTPPAT